MFWTRKQTNSWKSVSNENWLFDCLNIFTISVLLGFCLLNVLFLSMHKTSVVDKAKNWLAVTRDHCYTILKLISNVSQLISGSVLAIYLYKLLVYLLCTVGIMKMWLINVSFLITKKQNQLQMISLFSLCNIHWAVMAVHSVVDDFICVVKIEVNCLKII